MSIREAPPPRSGEGGQSRADSRRDPRLARRERRTIVVPVVVDAGRGRVKNGNGGRPDRVQPRRRVDVEPVPVRRVRRVVRHVDLWSVFRFSALLYASFLLVFMVAGVGLWLAATAVGARHSVEHFIASTLLFKGFHFDSLQILGSGLVIGAVLAALGTGINVVVAAFYNLISDVVGGVEFTVIEQEPAGPVV